MSKIGKKPIEIISGVSVTTGDGFIYVKGPKGELKKTLIDGVIVAIDGNIITVSPEQNKKDVSAKWGLQRAIIANMITGVTSGFEKILDFQGVGYKAIVKGADLELSLGYSHPVIIQGVPGVTFSVEKNSIKVSGIDNELIGKVAANIRNKRPPEPYKGSGIRYRGEIIKKKAGKKAATTG